ncbi:hypothetical protein [Methylocystis iwaonis]|uniref:hypothetical protein n=1 Tax=Methylocystis iwaonis TaxID=2885079 RepID=UPI002E7C12B6|nr:hypothetical protein [Methylocystis iwaonis]
MVSTIGRRDERGPIVALNRLDYQIAEVAEQIGLLPLALQPRATKALVLPRARHCERSEAIQGGGAALDCFVASLLAMTAVISYVSKRREVGDSAEQIERISDDMLRAQHS